MQSYNGEVPLWEHDCTRCVFLGNTWIGHWEYDLYHCDQSNETYVARWSSNSEDYISGLSFVTREPALAMAYARHNLG